MAINIFSEEREITSITIDIWSHSSGNETMVALRYIKQVTSDLKQTFFEIK